VVIIEMVDLLHIKSAMFIFVGRDRKHKLSEFMANARRNEPGSVIKTKEEKMKMCKIKNLIPHQAWRDSEKTLGIAANFVDIRI
jgi:hypothetical protein